MLTEAKQLQQNAVARLIELTRTKKDIVFRAPTGAGKTYMMADFMNRLLSENPNLVFVVSARSKGGLDKQNYDKFCEYVEKGFFTQLKPYLISSQISGEERLFIPTDYNVYILPSDLTKSGGRLMQGALSNFFINMTAALYGENKTLYLIKDECHIATSNLDLSLDFFTKTFYFSATPKLSRGQYPDVCIKDEDAENAKLIKSIEWGEETEGKDLEEELKIAISKYKEIKDDYINKLGVNPCLIIQISNKNKEERELEQIRRVLSLHQDLRWMLIVNDPKKCDTNDQIKTKLPVEKWKEFVKHNNDMVNVIIFKMVISEGWDIPRACMLYQVRETQSEQLDEQVIGRVRRNPRLLDFEKLPTDAQQLAQTAWVWGNKPKDHKKIYGVKWKNGFNIASNLKITTTRLKPLVKNISFDLGKFIEKQTPKITHKSIFDIGRHLQSADNQVKTLVYDYATDYTKWWQAVDFLTDIEKESKKFYNDYAQSMQIGETISFPMYSHYTDNGNYVNIGNWLWKRRDGQDKFSFDSEAEREWASILKDISADNSKQLNLQQAEMFDNIQPKVYLWGKNYQPNSPIKFEYYMGATLNSYPDFIMKDKFDRIHIFEVKSMNKSSSMSIDEKQYQEKIIELKKCYKQASKITDQLFYLPVIINDTWQIIQYVNGEEQTLSKEQFFKFVSNNTK